MATEQLKKVFLPIITWFSLFSPVLAQTQEELKPVDIGSALQTAAEFLFGFTPGAPYNILVIRFLLFLILAAVLTFFTFKIFGDEAENKAIALIVAIILALLTIRFVPNGPLLALATTLGSAVSLIAILALPLGAGWMVYETTKDPKIVGITEIACGIIVIGSSLMYLLYHPVVVVVAIASGGIVIGVGAYLAWKMPFSSKLAGFFGKESLRETKRILQLWAGEERFLANQRKLLQDIQNEVSRSLPDYKYLYNCINTLYKQTRSEERETVAMFATIKKEIAGIRKSATFGLGRAIIIELENLEKTAEKLITEEKDAMRSINVLNEAISNIVQGKAIPDLRAIKDHVNVIIGYYKQESAFLTRLNRILQLVEERERELSSVEQKTPQ